MWIWQVVAILAVLSNSIILLVTSNLKNKFTKTPTDYFWLIFAFENFILALIYILQFFIPDKPGWVKKAILKENY